MTKKKRQSGQPKKDAFLILRIPRQEKEKLVALAKEKKFESLSELIREYLWQYIDLQNS